MIKNHFGLIISGVMIIVSFFLPWWTYGGLFSSSGYDIAVGESIPESKIYKLRNDIAFLDNIHSEKISNYYMKMNELIFIAQNKVPDYLLFLFPVLGIILIVISIMLKYKPQKKFFTVAFLITILILILLSRRISNQFMAASYSYSYLDGLLSLGISPSEFTIYKPNVGFYGIIMGCFWAVVFGIRGWVNFNIDYPFDQETFDEKRLWTKEIIEQNYSQKK